MLPQELADGLGSARRSRAEREEKLVKEDEEMFPL